MKTRSCELCRSDARMWCKSDDAGLCWDCDLRVHSANFLVAKHTRTALCHVCHCHTPWSASGPSLGRTISLCSLCLSRSTSLIHPPPPPPPPPLAAAATATATATPHHHHYSDATDDEGDTDSDAFEGSSDDDDDDDDDDENQVVPWTSTPDPPPASTSCSEAEEEEEEDSSSLSRFHDSAFSFRSTTVHTEIGGTTSSSSSYMAATRSRGVAEEDGRPWKHKRVELHHQNHTLSR